MNNSKEYRPETLDALIGLVERLDAWAIGFAKTYSRKMDDYIFASEDERQSMPNPLPVKKTRVMFRITRLLIQLWQAKQAGNLPASIRIIFMEGGSIPPHYHCLVNLSNSGLSAIRKDANALKACVVVRKKPAQGSRIKKTVSNYPAKPSTATTVLRSLSNDKADSKIPSAIAVGCP